ncbi:MAG: hypothetical protein IPF75_06180 [Bacteroidetes bacterium]|nr:hypothetical protein [Bacteroidota bacterium]
MSTTLHAVSNASPAPSLYSFSGSAGTFIQSQVERLLQELMMMVTLEIFLLDFHLVIMVLRLQHSEFLQMVQFRWVQAGATQILRNLCNSC